MTVQTYDLSALADWDAKLKGRPMPTPAYGTPLPDLPTRRRQLRTVASALAMPLIPWQDYAGQLITAKNPEGSRLTWRYPTVVILVPRQAGKTAINRVVMTDRCLARRGSDVWMTAQQGQYARMLWTKLGEQLMASPFKQAVMNPRTKKAGHGGSGQEYISLGGSKIHPFAQGPTALHSQSPDFVSVDEVWSMSAEAGQHFTAAARPAMITRVDRQILYISAAGDDTSDYLKMLTKAGRSSVTDPASSMAYLEFSADPAADPYDPATWLFHPGLGHLITLSDLAEESKPQNNSHAKFMRSYMNIPLDAGSGVIDVQRWDDLTEDAEPPAAGLVFGFEAAIDRTAGSVWAAWLTDDDIVHLHVIETREGIAWMPDTLVSLKAARPDAELVAATEDGATGLVVDGLRLKGTEPTILSHRAAAMSWTLFKDRAAGKRVAHDGSPAVRRAILGAVESATGTGGEALDRRRSRVTVDALGAAMAAMWAATRPAPQDDPIQLWT